MRASRSLALVALIAFCACGFLGGPEGHYTIDRKRTGENLEHYAEQQFKEVFVKTRGANTPIPEEDLKNAKQAIRSMMEEVSIDLYLEKGGKFHGTSKIKGESDTVEGTWTLQNGSVTLVETHQNGKPLASSKAERLGYRNGLLSSEDAKSDYAFLVLSRS